VPCVSLETYIAQADVLNKRRVQVGLDDDLLQQLDEHAIEWRVLQASLVCLCERRPHRERDDDVIGVLGCAVAHPLASAVPSLPEA
jgi:hypothetical protein